MKLDVALLKKLRENISLPLPKIESWDKSAHSFDHHQLDAIEAAVLSGRPLLIRGEPGLGKSQIARAVAAAWHWRFITAFIHSRTEVEDLLFQIDHVGRLADASVSMLGAPVADSNSTDTGSRKKVLEKVGDIANYIRPGPIWQALKQSNKSGHPDDADDAYTIGADAGCVLLIDEIDKAHRDVPNALLEVLNSGKFKVPQTGETIQSSNGVFIVITANDERSLPAAFLRRCAVLELTLGQNPEQRLGEIAQTHVDNKLLESIGSEQITKVVAYVADYRRTAPADHYRPGTSEMLDMLRVINEFDSLTGDALDDRLQTLGKFLVMKGFSQDEIET